MQSRSYSIASAPEPRQITSLADVTEPIPAEVSVRRHGTSIRPIETSLLYQDLN